MRITSKQQCIAMLEAGQFGNIMPSWPSVEAARASGHTGTVMIRSRVPNSPYMRPDVPLEDVEATIATLVILGASRDDLYLTWMSPAEGRTINGELCEVEGVGLYLNYSTAQTHVRAALDQDGHHASCSAARAILRHTLADEADDLLGLLERFPGAVVEFTGFERAIGTLKRRLVIWEVRNY